MIISPQICAALPVGGFNVREESVGRGELKELAKHLGTIDVVESPDAVYLSHTQARIVIDSHSYVMDNRLSASVLGKAQIIRSSGSAKFSGILLSKCA